MIKRNNNEETQRDRKHGHTKDSQKPFKRENLKTRFKRIFWCEGADGSTV